MFTQHRKRAEPLTRRRQWYVVSGVILGVVLLGVAHFSYATVSAGAPGWFARTGTQVAAVWNVVAETTHRILADAPRQLAQLGGSSTVRYDGNTTPPSGAVALPRPPTGGSLLINTPLAVDAPLRVVGTTQLASTTIVGGATIDDATLATLTVQGSSVLSQVSVGGTLETNSLRVATEAALGSAQVTGGLSVSGELVASGGLVTNGATVDLGSGELFAANVVNEVQAGDNVRITGTRNEPIISFAPEPFRGVEEINGEDGDVEIEAGTDIDIDDLEIENTSRLVTVRARGGCTSCITDGDTRDDLTISGGRINDTTIGSSTRAAGYFTALTTGSTTASTTALSVAGAAVVRDALTVTGTATSTFTGSINITDGCLAVSGTCIAGGALSSYVGLTDTPGTLVAGALQFASSSGAALTQSSELIFDGTNLALGTTSARTRLTVGGGAISLLDREAVRWYDNSNSRFVGFRASSTVASSTVWTLPEQDGTQNQILVTDGARNLSFADVSAIGGGATTYLQLSDTPSSYQAGALVFASSSGARLTQSSELVYQNGSLGVGVGAPTERLSVSGNVAFAGLGSAPGFSFTQASGQVGIGTDAPSDSLTVRGGSFSQQGGTESAPYTPSIRGGIALGENSNDVALRLPYAYVVSDGSGNNFHTLDVTDPTNPVVVGGLDLVTNASALAVQGEYAYVVTSVSGDDLHVIDISDPTNPSEIGSVDLPTSATDVVVRGQYAYVGTASPDDGFHVIDISDPANPVARADVTLGDAVNSVAVHGDYAYAVTQTSNDDLHVIDISDPTNITEVESINLPSGARSLTVKGTNAYVVTGGGVVYVVDISDPLALSISGTESIATGGTDIFIAGRYVYVTSLSANADLHVIDVVDPTDPVEIGGADIGAGNALALQVVGRYAYVTTAAAGDSVHVLDITGAELQTALVHSLQAERVTIGGDANISGFLTSEQGLLVGAEGIRTDGELFVRGSGVSHFSGTVGIGTSTASETLMVAGTIRSSDLGGGTINLITDANGNIIRDTSDARLKENVTELSGALDTVLALRGVRYEWSDKERFGPQAEVGFIAQEVEPILPEVVRTGGDYWSINTRNIVAVVVEAVQEMWATVQTVQETLAALEERLREVEQLEARISELEKNLDTTSARTGPAPTDDATEVSTPEKEAATTDPVALGETTSSTDGATGTLSPDNTATSSPAATSTDSAVVVEVAPATAVATTTVGDTDQLTQESATSGDAVPEDVTPRTDTNATSSVDDAPAVEKSPDSARPSTTTSPVESAGDTSSTTTP